MRKLHLFSLALVMLSIVMNTIMIVPSIGLWSDFPIMILISLLITLFGVFSVEKSTILFEKFSNSFSSKDNFQYDFYVMNALVIAITFFYIFWERNNTDMKAWWIYAEVIFVMYGVIFSFLYALIGMLLKPHRLYTLVFSLVFLGDCVLKQMRIDLLNYILQIKILEYIPFVLPLLIHLIYCLSYRAWFAVKRN